jgi:hypothetical protein
MCLNIKKYFIAYFGNSLFFISHKYSITRTCLVLTKFVDRVIDRQPKFFGPIVPAQRVASETFGGDRLIEY